MTWVSTPIKAHCGNRPIEVVLTYDSKRDPYMVAMDVATIHGPSKCPGSSAHGVGRRNR